MVPTRRENEEQRLGGAQIFDVEIGKQRHISRRACLSGWCNGDISGPGVWTTAFSSARYSSYYKVYPILPRISAESHGTERSGQDLAGFLSDSHLTSDARGKESFRSCDLSALLIMTSQAMEVSLRGLFSSTSSKDLWDLIYRQLRIRSMVSCTLGVP